MTTMIDDVYNICIYDDENKEFIVFELKILIKNIYFSFFSSSCGQYIMHIETGNFFL